MVLTIRWLHMLVLLASIVLADLLQGSTLNSKQNAKHNTTRTHNTTLRESDVARVLDKLACDRGVLWLVLVLWLVVPETFITFITSFATQGKIVQGKIVAKYSGKI
jgi:hypothetical protein